MSYCRFSSMNMMCDVYVYEDCRSGWTTHVASVRRVIPPIPSIMTGSFILRVQRWAGANLNRDTGELEYPSRWRRCVSKAFFLFAAWWQTYIHGISLKIIPMRKIGLPMDGKAFNDGTAEACAGRLEALRTLGYRVPQYAIDALHEEA